MHNDVSYFSFSICILLCWREITCNKAENIFTLKINERLLYSLLKTAQILAQFEIELFPSTAHLFEKTRASNIANERKIARNNLF